MIQESEDLTGPSQNSENSQNDQSEEENLVTACYNEEFTLKAEVFLKQPVTCQLVEGSDSIKAMLCIYSSKIVVLISDKLIGIEDLENFQEDHETSEGYVKWTAIELTASHVEEFASETNPEEIRTFKQDVEFKNCASIIFRENGRDLIYIAAQMSQNMILTYTLDLSEINPLVNRGFLEGHLQHSTCLQFYKGKYLFSAGPDKMIFVWDIEQEIVVFTMIDWLYVPSTINSLVSSSISIYIF